jgi:hypothetical protein
MKVEIINNVNQVKTLGLESINTTYKVGDVIQIGMFYYLLAKISSFQYGLISLANGEKYTDLIRVTNGEKISQDEMESMICDTYFRKVEAEVIIKH